MGVDSCADFVGTVECVVRLWYVLLSMWWGGGDEGGVNGCGVD